MIAADTSVSVPAMLAGHRAHDECLVVVQRHRPALAGHAEIETFSVVTRLGGDRRVTAARAVQLLQANFAPTVWPEQERVRSFVEDCGRLGVAGGAVYDALVALAASSHGATLVTLDRRAAATYRAFGVEVVAPADLA